MPSALTYPGVYIEEIGSGVRTIIGVATSITAFIGRARRGPFDEPTRIQSYGEFERVFGALWGESTLGPAVNQFFQNGGAEALIVRVQVGATPATLTIGTLVLVAASPGVWGESLRARIDHRTRPLATGEADLLFNLTVRDSASGVTERFLNLSTSTTSARNARNVLANESKLVRTTTVPAAKPTASADPPAGLDPMADNAPPTSTPFANDGDDGTAISDAQISAPTLEAGKSGIWALEKADLFNLLCIPPLTQELDVGAQTRSAAATYCTKRRAIFLVDPLIAWDEPSDLTTGANSIDGTIWGMARSANAVLYFPQVRMPDALQEGRLSSFAPCGAMAGIMARTDASRGVWKAPAGIDATISGAAELSAKLTDGENGILNPLGVNCLRSFPVIGRVVWGARTLVGADQLADQWKYLPVRRTALYIEETLYRATQWVVFEPNDEPLWAQIRLNIGAFMQGMFRQGAFQGQSPRDAYFVKCDKETTTQDDINRGVVNIVVGFAPLKPAEFVVIKLQQIAGQIQA